MFEGRQVETDYVFLKFENGILYGKYLIKKLDLDVAKAVMDIQYKTYTNKTEYIITDLVNIKSATKEARDYFSRKEFSEHVKAAAFIAPTFLHKLMFTFFLTFNKPVIPTAFFTNLEDATNWIKKHQKAPQK